MPAKVNGCTVNECCRLQRGFY